MQLTGLAALEHTVELSKAKYSRHIVPKLLQYGTRPQRDAIIVQFYGHVRRLMRQKVQWD
jgi:pumilio family protein 6